MKPDLLSGALVSFPGTPKLVLAPDGTAFRALYLSCAAIENRVSDVSIKLINKLSRRPPLEVSKELTGGEATERKGRSI